MTYSVLSEHLFLFTFSDLIPFETNILVYHGREINLIIDTFIGPARMKQVIDTLPLPFASAPYTVVNTHYHYDHVWGNSFFPFSIRIATPLCYQWIQQNFEKEKKQNIAYWEPGNQLCLPNCLIQSTLIFPREGIEIFLSPRHTEDGCSVFFQQERVLAVGDNLEKPLPFLENQKWSLYLDTLDRYQAYQAQTIIAGHGKVDQADLVTTKQYILDWKQNNTADYEKEPFIERHWQNKL